jgi:neurotransmitter:Na+ symporter, NSS family
LANAQRAHWGSRLAFILAAAGSAIGLGNIWKFPYITGVNGGGLFVLVYLGCILLVGVPVLIAELYIGQKAQSNAVTAFERTHKPKTLWRLPGWLGLASAFFILSFYSVVGGWILYYTYLSITGQLLTPPPEEIGKTLTELFASPLTQTVCHFLFMATTVVIVMAGVKNGLERWTKILMPVLFLILVGLLVRVFFLEGFPKAISFLFSIHEGEMTAHGWMEAVGHSFFTLSLGMGAMITYGSYLSEKENLVRAAVAVAFLDTLIALMAGVVIFAIVFSFGLQPSSGPGLIFATLPVLFAQMTGGWLVATAFFLLIFFAALTSAVSLLEVVVAYWTESHGVDRHRSTVTNAVVIFILGLLSALSTNVLAEVKILGLTFFDLFDKMTSSYMLPIGGILISVFFGWTLGKQAALNAANRLGPVAVALLWITRIAAPIAVLLVLWNLVFGL